MATPRTQFARSGDVNIAYQVIGKGSIDLMLVLGFATHIEVMWELPAYARFIERLSAFARVIVFDKRGMGLSDRPSVISTFEQQHDDVRAVLDAVGSERPALFGFTEGGPMCLLFAATYPHRTRALVLLSSYAKFTRTADYPFGATREVEEKLLAKIAAQWGREPFLIQAQAPSRVGDRAFENWLWKLQRHSQSPGSALSWYKLTTEIDVRNVLPVIHVPTLILHRTGDRIVDVGHSRFMAQHIADAKYIELPGNDNFPGSGDTEGMLDEVEEFLTGMRPVVASDRVLATVMMTDIVGSTETAVRIGDRKWRSLLESHYDAVRSALDRFGGREVDTAGDGVLATFDGPARAIRCASVVAQEVRALGLDVRIGLHSGECEVIGEKVGGVAVHIAARVAAQAVAQQILVTSTVRDLVIGSGIRFSDRGTVALKGLPDQWRLFAVEPGST